jgi:histidinol dehydrogenase
VLCTPPNREGRVHPAILYAAQLAGITQIYKVGGAQAIAAMAFGTETIPQVYKIFGPGNQYVTAAKQLVNRLGVAIDMPAGPSEVAVVADADAPVDFIAADLLSQAEHGADSQSILLTTDARLATAVGEEVARQLAQLPRRELAAQSIANSRTFVLNSEDDLVDMVNAYAAEHLILATRNAELLAERIHTAGSIFLGYFTPESAGDYASGTNHTLPTNGFARAWSGVSLDSFVKKITYQHISPEGLQNLGPVIEELASAEELEAHRMAVTRRLNYLNRDETI